MEGRIKSVSLLRPRRSGIFPIALSILFFITPICSAELFRLTIDADKSIQIVGDYHPPKSTHAPVLVMLHGLGSSRGEWDLLVKKAINRGWGVFAYDARGHGESTVGPSGKRVDYRDPVYGRDPAFWFAMVSDLRRIVAALEERKVVSPDRMVIVGASLGANVALAAAREEPRIPAIVLLSPGLDYAGIRTEPLIKRWDRPALLVASEPDRPAHAAVQRLPSLAVDPARVETLLWKPGPQGSHGVQMFDGALEEKILTWIENKTTLKK